MVIAVNHYKIAYMALPKSACTAVKAALARIDLDVRLPPQAEYSTTLWHRIYPTTRFRPHRWEKYGSYWRFCVVRDPAKRLMSCYTDRVVKRKELRNSRKIHRGHFDLPVDPDPDFFFQNLKTYARAASVIKHHALPARLFLGPRLHSYDRIYKTENLGQLVLDLNERTGREIILTRENPSDVKLDLNDLKPRTLDVLKPYLDEEYALLQGYYDNPLASSTVHKVKRKRRPSAARENSSLWPPLRKSA